MNDLLIYKGFSGELNLVGIVTGMSVSILKIQLYNRDGKPMEASRLVKRQLCEYIGNLGDEGLL